MAAASSPGLPHSQPHHSTPYAKPWIHTAAGIALSLSGLGIQKGTHPTTCPYTQRGSLGTELPRAHGPTSHSRGTHGHREKTHVSAWAGGSVRPQHYHYGLTQQQ
ncbi:Hypothetical predicted protein, partial [Pelobates cultripes]